MITLHTFGPAFGLPDPSPFVTKAQMLLKIAGLDYRTHTGGLRKAPKGKLPYLVDDGETVADSTFIRWHLERKYGIDFDRGLGAPERACAWAFEKMVEDNLYWVIVVERWLHERNFANGPRRFFDTLPALLRPVVVPLIRRKVRNAARAQGMGRHGEAERTRLGVRSVTAVSDFLADKPYFMGADVTGIDATLFAFIGSVLCPIFDSDVRRAAEQHANLRDYVQRLQARYSPDLGPA